MRTRYNGGHRSVDRAEWMDLVHALCDKNLRDTYYEYIKNNVKGFPCPVRHVAPTGFVSMNETHIMSMNMETDG